MLTQYIGCTGRDFIIFIALSIFYKKKNLSSKISFVAKKLFYAGKQIIINSFWAIKQIMYNMFEGNIQI